jgi:glutathione S-transferase
MFAFIVHSVPGSPFGRAVLATLEEKGASYQVRALGLGAARSPEHLARHPFGRVPVIDHDGFMLYETQAILRYLDRVLPAPPLTPAGPKAAARMDQAINVNDWYLFAGCANGIGFQRVVKPRLMGLPPDEAAITAAMPKSHVVFEALARMLGDQAYFAGEAVSLADLMLAAQIEFFVGTPQWDVLAAPRENLCAWLKRLQDRPSFAATTWDRVAATAA